uniref:Uncharacterized protein n=1 Tax=Ananas comosus var. bracteatus TaxID=296719 RepID=A0A6V7Q518_ANACO|nr:unnamed protein product [Ananas comosus var. bracteatus]
MEQLISLEAPLLTSSNNKREGLEVIQSELKKQLWLAGPLIAGNLLQNIIRVISLMFVGHFGELDLSGASMATSFATVTGFSLLVILFSCIKIKACLALQFILLFLAYIS